MARQSAHRSVSPATDAVAFMGHMTDALTRKASSADAANEAKLVKEPQVNPLWMITAALAVMVVLGLLFA